jgi:hypothetical protein
LSKKRNVTVSLDEATARWARIEAARRDTSLSEFLATLLREQMSADAEYEQALTLYLAAEPVVLKERGRYPGRDKLHERTRLR